jgi:hypothetical protein
MRRLSNTNRREAREAAAREAAYVGPQYRGREVLNLNGESYDAETGLVSVEFRDGSTGRVLLREIGVDTQIADVEEAEEEAYIEKDVRYIERLFQASAGTGSEGRELAYARQKLGTPRYMKAFAAWEDKYLG